ncbi:MAG: calcium-translocating P-type ATPase, PMCA-type [Christensenellales bacterium]
MEYYRENTDIVLSAMQSDPDGLRDPEANNRLTQYGKNKLDEGKKTTLLARFFAQMADPMILILLAAAFVSGITSYFSGEDYTDVFIILIVVLLNATLGVYQENKAERAIEALQAMSSPTSKVIRSGRLITIKSEDIVVGDILLLEAGDAVPADGRITESYSLKAEEAALTGESVPVDKSVAAIISDSEQDIPLGDRINMVYMGSVIVYGRGKAVVTDTGMKTEMGKIADALTKTTEGKTPLQIKLHQLSKILSYVVIGISLFIFAFTLFRKGSMTSSVILDTFMIAISLAVAAIPEGLATVVTIVLSVGVTNMSKRNAVIRRLTAVETLGCAQIICSDKTGTLTQNKMTVVDHYGNNETLLAASMALCSDAELDQDGMAKGEPTECALVNYASSLGLLKPDLKAKAPRIGEAPFDSMRKMMSTVHQTEEGIIQYTKGALDEVLRHSSRYLDSEGSFLPLTDEVKGAILSVNKKMAGKALRVLCAAMRFWPEEPPGYTPTALENDLIWIGLTGMIDPIRPEVLHAIAQCRSAGIRPIMITGDHIDTAIAIATELGIISSPDQAVTGTQLNAISDEELTDAIERYGVYARVQPEHKVRIVNAWRAKGYVTAMTGDGVNDAPSIKSADIGIGMGITGTDVTKNVADMVLADDNFATIVNAISEGRRIYDNIRKTIQFLLASNLSEVLSIFIATIIGFTVLRPVHLLWINLITDTFPALALGMEKSEPDIMKRAPRSTKEGVFAGGLGFDVIYQGIVVTILTLIAYLIGCYLQNGIWEFRNSADGITMAFLTMSMAEIFHSFNMRSRQKSIFALKTRNFYLWGAMAASLLFTAAVIYVPFLSRAFEFASVSFLEYGISMGLAIAVIPVVELIKLMRRQLHKKGLNLKNVL